MRLTTLALLLLAFGCASKQKTPAEKALDVHYNYGTEFLMNKNYTEAITQLLKAVEIAPENPEVHNNLGMAYYFKGEKASAERHIRRALALDAKNTDARNNLASLRFEAGDLAEAERLYKECLKDLTYEKQARVYFNLSLIAQRQGNRANTESYLRLSLKEDDSYCPAWFQLGQFEYQARDLKQALKNFREAGMGMCANDPAPLYWQGVVLGEMGDTLAARMKFDELETRFPRTSFAVQAREQISRLNLHESHPAPANRAGRGGVTTPTY